MRPARTFISPALLAACVLASSCTSDPEAVIDTTTTTTEAVVTTVETPTTTTVPTTSGEVSDDTAALEAHTAFMTEFFVVDERADGYTGLRAAAPEFTAGAALARALETSAAREAAQEFLVSPGLDSNIVEFAIEGAVAEVWDCSRGRGSLVDESSDVIDGPDVDFELRKTRVERIDEVWLVTEFNTGGEPCDPNEFS